MDGRGREYRVEVESITGLIFEEETLDAFQDEIEQSEGVNVCLLAWDSTEGNVKTILWITEGIPIAVLASQAVEAAAVRLGLTQPPVVCSVDITEERLAPAMIREQEFAAVAEYDPEEDIRILTPAEELKRRLDQMERDHRDLMDWVNRRYQHDMGNILEEGADQEEGVRG